MVLLLRILFK